jgi:hypothetical protein
VASVARDPDTILRFTSTGKPSFCVSLDIRQEGASRVSLTRGQGTHCAEKDLIKKVSGGYKVVSKKGKNLGGPCKTKAEAQKRLRQVEFYKRNKG